MVVGETHHIRKPPSRQDDPTESGDLPDRYNREIPVRQQVDFVGDHIAVYYFYDSESYL